MLRRIEQEVSIGGGENGLIRVLDCAILLDDSTGSYSLELNLQNDSGHTLAEVTICVVGFDRAGREVGSQEQTYTIRWEADGGFAVRADRRLSLPMEQVSRLSVRVGKALVYLTGDEGPTESIL